MTSVACGDKKPTTPVQNFVPYDAGGGPPLVATSDATAPPPAGSCSGTAQIIDPTMAALATTAVAQIAGTEAPGMTPEGAVCAANFTTGSTLETTFQMMPGKCYTVVGVGAGIQQLDISATVVSPLPGFNMPFGVNDKKVTPIGSQSVLGAKVNCLKTLLPMQVPVKITVTATKGQGLAAAQLYSK